MNLIKFSPVVTAVVISLLAAPAQAFSIGGNPSYATNALPTELSVNNEVRISDGDTQFTVSDPNALQIGTLFLEGSLGESGFIEDSFYSPVLSYITGFQFLGREAVFNLNAGQDVLAGFINGSNFTIDSLLSGDIVDLSGNTLGTAVGSFSSVQTGSAIGNFSIDLSGAPINPDTTTPKSVPAPSMLFGMIGLVIGALQKYANELAE